MTDPTRSKPRKAESRGVRCGNPSCDSKLSPGPLDLLSFSAIWFCSDECVDAVKASLELEYPSSPELAFRYPDKNGWHSVKDSLPDVDVNVLVYCPADHEYGSVVMVWTASLRPGGGVSWEFADGVALSCRNTAEPTHWKPLPTPPGDVATTAPWPGKFFRPPDPIHRSKPKTRTYAVPTTKRTAKLVTVAEGEILHYNPTLGTPLLIED